MKPRLFGLVWLVAMLSSGVAMAAASDQPDLLTRTKHYASSYKINEDGTSVMERSWAITVLKEQAVARSKQASISYSTSVEKSEILDAYTLKADGRRIDAPKSNFQVEANSGKDKNIAAFSDDTSLTVIFPDVTVGDTVVLAYRITTTEAIFPRHFSTLETFPKTVAYDDVDIKIDAPAALWTQYQIKDMKEVLNIEKDGRRLIEWTWENKNPIKSKRDDYSVYDREQVPGYSFSTFKNYAEIAENYGLRARPKAVITERVQKLADEIAKDKQSQPDIAHALYDWVAVNISYAGNCVGIGTVVPRDLDFVIGNRMGDCKDHATLLQALLAAKGIPSTQALINAGSAYKLAKVPVVSMVNHVINYIPSLNLYLDSTSETTPYGMLPFSDVDKPVLLVDGYKDGTKTPKASPGDNRQVMKSTIKISEDGSAQGTVSVDLRGYVAVESRDYFREMTKETEADLVKNYFKYSGLEASGSFSKEDPKPLVGEHHYAATFNVKNLYNLPGPSAFAIGPLMFSHRPVSSYVAALNQSKEEVELVSCMGGHAVEEYVYELPKNVKFLAIPQDFKMESDNYTYTASYKKVGHRLTVRRTFDDQTIGNVCSIQTIKAQKQFADKVVRNLRAQVIIQPANATLAQ